MSVYDASISIGVKADTASAKSLKATLDEIAASARKTNELLAQNATQNKNVSAATKDTTKSVGGLSSAFAYLKTIVQGYIGLQLAQYLMRTADAFTIFENKMRVVSSNMDDFTRQSEMVIKIARDTRTSLDTAGNAYSRYRIALSELNPTMEDTAKVTQSVINSFRLSGATTAEANAAAIQLGQGFSFGVLRGDEFRSVSEQNAVMMGILTEKLGKTRGELIKMAFDGQITAKMIKDIMGGAFDDLNNKAKSLQPTFAEAFTSLNREIGIFLGKSVVVRGVFDAFVSLALFTAKNIDTIAIALTAVAGVAAAFMASSFVVWIGGLPALIGAIATAVMANPLGLLITGLGAVGVAAYTFRTEIYDFVISTIAGLIVMIDKAIAKLKDFAYSLNDSLGASSVWVANQVGLIDNETYNTAIGLAGSRQNSSTYLNPNDIGQSIIDMQEQFKRNWGDAPSPAAGGGLFGGMGGNGSGVGGGGTSGASSAAKAAEKAIKAQTDAHNELKQVVASTRTEYEKYNDEIKRLNALKPFAKTPLEIDAINRAMIAANDNLQKWVDEANLSKQVWNDFGQSAGQTIDTFISDLTRAEVTFKSFGQMALNVLTDVMQAMIRTMNGGQSIGQSIGGMLGNAMLGSLGGLGGGKVGGDATGGIWKVPAMATGGSLTFGGYGGVDKNVLSMNGSPIARVSRGETMTVTPQGVSSSSGVVINMSFSVDATAAVKAQIMQAAPTITQAAIAGVNQARARGYAA